MSLTSVNLGRKAVAPSDRALALEDAVMLDSVPDSGRLGSRPAGVIEWER
jgi:hypothetical protein